MENGRTRLHLDRLARALRGAKMIVVNSPGNPTGGILAAEDLEQIAWWADRYDVIIYSDEVFGRYCYTDQCPASAACRRPACGPSRRIA